MQFNLIAQLDDRSIQLTNSTLFNSDSTAGWVLNARGLGYFVNHERDSPIVEGETFFGFQQHASISKAIDSYLHFEVGALANKIFGQDKLFFAPILNIKYKKNDFYLRLGDLSQAGIRKKLYALESQDYLILNPARYGFEYQWLRNGWNLNGTIVWHQAIQRGDDNSEQFWVNLGIEKTIKDTFTLGTIVQAHHTGGEINVKPRLVSNVIFFVPYIEYHTALPAIKMDKFTLHIHYLHQNSDLNPNGTPQQDPKKNGKGIWLSAEMTFKKLQLMVGFFNYNAVTIQNGNLLYNGQSLKVRGDEAPNRRFNSSTLTFRAKYVFAETKKYAATIQTTGDYNFAPDATGFSYSYQLWIKYNLTQRLLR